MSSESQELSYYTTSIGESSSMAAFLVNNTWTQDNLTSAPPYMLPAYFQTTSIIVCVAIMVLGIIGNLLVPIVVFRNKDMRNSTNIFLVNLSIADLCVLLICTPTILMEVISGPQVWPLGKTMCIIVPFVELTVAHASVLTILAISFERYYAICEPLRAGYVCTKARAFFICVVAWIAAALCTSPIILMTAYEETITEGQDEVVISVCLMEVDAKWKLIYHIGINIVFFTIPFVILTALYTTITRHLIANPIISRDPESNLVKYRRQVVLMLGTVVVSFFCCLLPFRIFGIWIIFFFPEEQSITNQGVINYFLGLYVCRFLVYFNSAVNPILYNIMSTKFRDGFQKLCCRRNFDHSSGNTPVRNSRMTSSTPTQITLKSNSAKSGSSTSCTFATTSSIKYNTNIYNDLSINCENNVNIFLTEQNPVVKTDKQSKFPLLIHEKNTITILGKSTETYV